MTLPTYADIRKVVVEHEDEIRTIYAAVVQFAEALETGHIEFENSEPVKEAPVAEDPTPPSIPVEVEPPVVQTPAPVEPAPIATAPAEPSVPAPVPTPITQPANTKGPKLPRFKAGLNYTGLANNLHVPDARVPDNYRTYEDRFTKAIPECKLWRYGFSLARCLKASQGMGLDETYMKQIEEALDGFYANGSYAILDAHEWLREWKLVEEIPGIAYGTDPNDPARYGRIYRIADKAIMSWDDWGTTNFLAWGSQYKKDPNLVYQAYVDNRKNAIALTEWHVMGLEGAPRIYNIDGFVDTWLRVIGRFMNHPAVWGWELMNEPFLGIELDPKSDPSLPTHERQFNSFNHWTSIVKELVPRILAKDPNHFVIVGGNDWQNASTWPIRSDELKDLEDPNGQIIYAAHYYLDEATRGAWEPRDQAVDINKWQEVQPFFDWLEKNNKQGMFSEFGYPAGNLSAKAANKRLIEEAVRRGVTMIQWATGPGWSNDDVTCVTTEGATIGRKDNLDEILPYLSQRFDTETPA